MCQSLINKRLLANYYGKRGIKYIGACCYRKIINVRLVTITALWATSPKHPTPPPPTTVVDYFPYKSTFPSVVFLKYHMYISLY